MLTRPSLLLLLGLAASGCAASSAARREASVMEAQPASLTLTADRGWMLGGSKGLAKTTWQAVQAPHWPLASKAPLLGYLCRSQLPERPANATVLGLQLRDALSATAFAPVASFEAAPTGKQLVAFTRKTDRSVALEGAAARRLAVGERYALLDLDPERCPERISDSMVAIAQVQRIDGDVAVAAVVQGTAPAAGLAMLTGPERSSPQLVTIHIANSAEGAEPPMDSWMEELSTLAAEQGVTNLAIRALPEKVDPADSEPGRLIEPKLSYSDLGVILGWSFAGGAAAVTNLVVGEPPVDSKMTAIRMLPGGLALPATKAADLPRLMAPSLLSSAASRRGDFAEAVLIARDALAQEGLPAGLRSHLTEIYAANLNALGLDGDALRVISLAVADARAKGDERAELNTLDIRSALADSVGLEAAAMVDRQRSATLSALQPNPDMLWDSRVEAVETALRGNDPLEAAALAQTLQNDARMAKRDDLLLRSYYLLAEALGEADGAQAALVLGSAAVELKELPLMLRSVLQLKRVAALLGAGEQRTAMALLTDIRETLAEAPPSHARSRLFLHTAELSLEMENRRSSAASLVQAVAGFVEAGGWSDAMVALDGLIRLSCGVDADEEPTEASMADCHTLVAQQATYADKAGMPQAAASSRLLLAAINTRFGLRRDAEALLDAIEQEALAGYYPELLESLYGLRSRIADKANNEAAKAAADRSVATWRAVNEARRGEPAATGE